MMRRREFLAFAAGTIATRAAAAPGPAVQTVRGPVPVSQLGPVLTHEHVLVDFGGADVADPGRYNTGEVIRAATPRFLALKETGCRTFVDCTPAYLGRDPALLRRLSEATGINILTNTGYYGAANGKYLPPHAQEETAEPLAARWTAEWQNGIDGTGIRPAFIKTGVNGGELSGIDRKLVVAACLCSRQTGMRVHVHTGDGAAATSILDTLREQGTPVTSYIWVHAQNEKNREVHIKAARAGAWVSFDGLGEGRVDEYVAALKDMAEAGLLDHVLISQDSGWYHVGEPDGGDFKGYTFLFTTFLPELRTRGFSEAQIRRLTVENPARVLTPGPATLPPPPPPKPFAIPDQTTGSSIKRGRRARP